MSFIVNFQVIINLYDSEKTIIKRSTYSISQKEAEQYRIKNIKEVYDWFRHFFRNNSLDLFIDSDGIEDKEFKMVLKIGRVTNSDTGEFLTY